MIAAVRGANFPEQARIFLDAEKAIIRAMNPAYNKELFKAYPTSKDGLYKDRYDAICYTFRDPITLVYNEGEILGGPDLLASDLIMISNYKELKLVKRR